jgi:hypothetical protein
MNRARRAWRSFRAMPSIVQFGAYLALAILIMLALPSGARAEDRIARQGHDEVMISESPCMFASVLIEIDKVLPGQREQFRRAVTHFGGKKYFACWRPMGGGAHLVYEDGDQGIVPFADFKRVLSL